VDVTDLKTFATVARLGGMNRAAAELHTVQSNVTARIRALEQELGSPLFERHSRGVALTPAGRRLLPYAERMGHLLAEARRAVADDGAPRGALNVGSLESTAALRLPRYLVAFAETYPEVDLVLVPGTTAEMVERVLDRQVEGAFVCGPVSHPDLIEEVMFREQLVVVTARRVQTLQDALGRRDLKIVVLRLGCSYRQRLEEVLARRGMVVVRRLEFGTIDGIMGCVSAGVGITLLPRSVAAAAYDAGQVAIHELPADEAHVETVFVRPRDGFVSSALDAFLRGVRGAAVMADAAE
jgi:LysR family transcriptional regulator, cell division regulator